MPCKVWNQLRSYLTSSSTQDLWLQFHRVPHNLYINEKEGVHGGCKLMKAYVTLIKI